MWPSVLRNAAFRRLWTASTIDAFGSWLLVFAVPLQAFILTGSAMSTGLALAVQALPAVLIGPWAGLAVDRWPRRMVIVAANVVSAAAVALMLLATTPDRVGFLYAGLLVESIALCFLRPALAAATPAVLGDESDLASANALSAFTNSAFRMLGPLLGTFLVARGWFPAVVLIDLASYLAAAAIILTVAIPPTSRPAGVGRRIRTELGAGLGQIRRTPLLRGLLTTSCVYWTANAALTALLIPFVTLRLDGSGQTLGYLIAGLGIGYLCGSALSKILISRYDTRAILTISYAGVGLCFLVVFSATSTLVAVLALTVCGVPGAVAQVVTGHRLQTSTPDAVLGRVSAAFHTSDAVPAVTGALLAPALAALLDLGPALILLSVTVLAIAALALAILPATVPPARRTATARAVPPAALPSGEVGPVGH